MSGMDLFDDIMGPLDVLDWIESWATFALAKQSDKGPRLGRTNLQMYSIPRADKMEEQRKRIVSLNEAMDYLRHFGIIVKAHHFDSERMYFQVRRNQNKKGWVDRLLNVDADGIPQLDYARMNWDDKRKAAEAAKRAAKPSFWEWLFS